MTSNVYSTDHFQLLGLQDYFRMARNQDMRPRVCLGMSGGVDSSTAAAQLLDAGFEVVGVTCVFCAGCKTDQAIADARVVAKRLGIRHEVWDASVAFNQQVVQPFVDDYVQAATPSPCVVCNATCKMPSLIAAANQFKCNYIATGHYARIAYSQSLGRYALCRGADLSKDQSYMLAQLDQNVLSRLIFPLGYIEKTQVRSLAKGLQLEVADKPESQDVCFVSGKYTDFLKSYGVQDKPGAIVDVQGRHKGTHQGLFYYTIGQRKGIGIAGPEPYYVIDKRFDTNELVIGFQDEASILGVEATGAIWQAFDNLTEPLRCKVKLRYRSEPAWCWVYPDCKEQGDLRIDLDCPQASTAQGQYAVFYDETYILGSARISAMHRAQSAANGVLGVQSCPPEPVNIEQGCR